MIKYTVVSKNVFTVGNGKDGQGDTNVEKNGKSWRSHERGNIMLMCNNEPGKKS